MTSPKSKRTETVSKLEEIIEKAGNLEACRDMDAVREVLRPIWKDVNETPAFDSYDEPIRAELLRLAGFFLAFDGYSKSKMDRLERGRDLITKAIELFRKGDCLDRVTMGRISLALCYWYEGASAEAEAILNTAEAQYAGNRESDVYIQIRYYRLVTEIGKEDFEAAARIIEELRPLVKRSKDKRIKALYHTEAGVNCRRQKRYKEAERHYLKAIEYADNLDIGGLVATNLNNLAFLNTHTGHFEKALAYIDQAIAINKRLKQSGFLAHKYDTKALIYFSVRDYENALLTIDKAIRIFRKGEDYLGLCYALFDKAKILLRLNRTEEGLQILPELLETARIRLGGDASERFAKDFAKLIYPKKGLAYREEVRLFQRDLVKTALIDSGLVLSKATELLSVTQQGLSDILNKQFPDICEEVGIVRSGPQRKIAPIILKNLEIEGFDPKKVHTYEIHKEKLPQLEAKRNLIIAVSKEPNQKLEEGKYFLVQCLVKNIVECGLVRVDESLGLYSFENDGAPSPFTPKDVRVIGEIVGYCYKDDAVSGKIRFRPLS